MPALLIWTTSSPQLSKSASVKHEETDFPLLVMARENRCTSWMRSIFVRWLMADEAYSEINSALLKCCAHLLLRFREEDVLTATNRMQLLEGIAQIQSWIVPATSFTPSKPRTTQSRLAELGTLMRIRGKYRTQMNAMHFNL